MLVEGFPATAFGTNCYVLAPDRGEECVVVDPGHDVTDRLDELLTRHRLRPVAVLLTHGHVDHTYSVTPVCGARGIPAYVHPADRWQLADPAGGLGMNPVALAPLFGETFTWSEPEGVAELTDGATVSLAGMTFVVDHAPGHTPGSVLFRVTDGDRPICLSGDVLFAGSIGRVDLPGGDPNAMVASLRDKILPLADDTVVLPGHGPATTIGQERAGNPYLRRIREAQSASRRGAAALD